MSLFAAKHEFNTTSIIIINNFIIIIESTNYGL